MAAFDALSKRVPEVATLNRRHTLGRLMLEAVSSSKVRIRRRCRRARMQAVTTFPSMQLPAKPNSYFTSSRARIS